MAGSKVFAKTGGEWIPVYPEPPRGAAPALSAISGDMQVALTWTAATGVTVASYEISVDGVVENVGNVLTFTKTGLTNDQTYSFRVRAKDASNVRGPWSNSVTIAPNAFNAATGGTVTDVPNYLGTTETWRVHTYSGSGDFVVSKSGQPFNILVCGAGSPGGGGRAQNGGGNAGAGGSGGKYLYNTAAVLAAGTIPVVVGTNGAASTLGSFSSDSGVAGGAPNSAGVKLTISGAEVGYCGGGGNGGYATANGDTGDVAGGAPGYDGGGTGGASQPDYIAYYGGGEAGVRGGGGGGGAGGNSPHEGSTSGGGSTGTVVIAYRIA